MARAEPDKRSRLIASAAKLVYRDGFNETTIAKVAEAARVPLGNVYYYFKTKDDIGEALLDQARSLQRQLLDQLEKNDDAKARLMLFVDSALAHKNDIAQSGCAMGTLATQLNKNSGALARQAGKLYAELHAWLAAQFALLGHRRDAARLATQLLASVEGSSLLTHVLHDVSHVEHEGHRLKAWIRAL